MKVLKDSLVQVVILVPLVNLMKKTEARWNTILNQYLREKKLYCFYELKQTTAKSFPFSKIEKHQWEGLEAMEKNGLVWKLSDEDQRQKPCDGFSIPPLPSYLVIKWPDGFYFIRFEEILKLKRNAQTYIFKGYAEIKAEHIIKLNLKKNGSKNKN